MYTSNEIWEEARAFAHNLRIAHKLKKGDRVILCYNFGLQLFAAFLGDLRAAPAISKQLAGPNLLLLVKKYTNFASNLSQRAANFGLKMFHLKFIQSI